VSGRRARTRQALKCVAGAGGPQKADRRSCWLTNYRTKKKVRCRRRLGIFARPVGLCVIYAEYFDGLGIITDCALLCSVPPFTAADPLLGWDM